MAQGIFWDGASFYEPGVKSRIDKSGLASISASGNSTLVLIGDADSSEPMKLTKIANSLDARQKLVGGALLQAYLFAAAPSPSLQGASDVAVINIRDLQAPETFINLNKYQGADASTGFVNDTYHTPDPTIQRNVIRVKSKIFGNAGQKLKFKWKDDVSLTDDDPRRYLSIDTGDGLSSPMDIRKVALELKNPFGVDFAVEVTGAGQLNIDVVVGTTTSTDPLDGTGPLDDVIVTDMSTSGGWSYTLSSYETVGELVDQLNEDFETRAKQWYAWSADTNDYGYKLLANPHLTVSRESKLEGLLDVTPGVLYLEAMNSADSDGETYEYQATPTNIFHTFGLLELTCDTANLISLINSRYGNEMSAELYDTGMGALPTGSDNEWGDRAVKRTVRMYPPKDGPEGLTGVDIPLSSKGGVDRFFSALDLLVAEYVDTIVCVTDLLDREALGELNYTNSEQSSVHSAGMSHVLQMSTTKRGKRRRYVAAAPHNDIRPSEFDRITASYNCNRVLYVGYGMWDYHYAGKGKVKFSPVYTAVKIASMISGNSPQVSLTSQSIAGIAPAYDTALNEVEKEDCIKASVIVPVLDEGRNFVLRSMSSHRTDGNYFDVEPSVLRCSDFTQNDLEKKLNESRIAWTGAGTAPQAADIQRVINRTLQQHEILGWISASDNGPAFANVQARVEGDAFYWDVDLRFPIPKNFGFGTHHLVK